MLVVLTFITSCDRKGKGQRSAMVLDTLASSPEMEFYKTTDSIKLLEPLFYDSSKSMLKDSDPSDSEQKLPERLPLPDEPRE